MQDNVWLNPIETLILHPPEERSQQFKMFDYEQGLVDDDRKVFNYGDFIPWDYQQALIQTLDRYQVRRGFLILPRRAGKTHLMIVYTIRRSLQKAMDTDLPNLQYGFCYQELSSGKRIAWDHMCNITEGLPERRINTHEGSITYSIINRKKKKVKITLRIVGLKNIHAKRGLFFDGLVIDERGFIMEGWKPIIMPTLADIVRQPTWLIMIGTPSEGCGFWEDFDQYELAFKQGKPGYFVFKANYNSLKHITEEMLLEQKEVLSKEQFEREFFCKRGGSMSGTYFPEELRKLKTDKRLKWIPEDTAQGKVLVCDIGSTKSDKFAIIVYQANTIIGKIQAINYTEISNATPEKFFEWVALENRYRVHQIVLPWDGATGFAETTKDALMKMFPTSDVITLPKANKLPGIIAARSFLNAIEINDVNCQELINCLTFHSKKWDEERGVFTMDPKHDPWSHGVDAFRYSAVAYQTGKMFFDKNFLNMVNGIQETKPPEPYNIMSDLTGG